MRAQKGRAATCTQTRRPDDELGSAGVGSPVSPTVATCFESARGKKKTPGSATPRPAHSGNKDISWAKRDVLHCARLLDCAARRTTNGTVLQLGQWCSYATLRYSRVPPSRIISLEDNMISCYSNYATGVLVAFKCPGERARNSVGRKAGGDGRKRPSHRRTTPY